tara:strand:- start:5624 stop:7084 length:1461 start_codon:yes stop_codon:yes gene_type:complete
MENNNSNKPKLYHGRRPVTRREFLASGAIPMMSYMIPSALMTTFAKAGIAQAQELCKVGEASKFPPIVNINANGGWWVAGNNIFLTEGRELLPSYGRNGLGSAANLVSQIVKTGHFKNQPPFYSGSGFLAGVQTSLVNGAASAALAKTNFVSMPLQSQNDSDTNKLAPFYLLQKAGLSGKILPNLGRTDNGIGVSNASAFGMSPAPLIVNNVDNIVNALGVGDRLAQLNQVQKTNLFKASQNLSFAQSRKLASLTGGSLLDRLLGQANADNSKLIENPAGLDLDPRMNAQFAAVWGLNNNTPKNAEDYINASLIYNAINGNCGAVGIEVGGCDYHGSTLAQTIAKDNEIGTLTGKILQSFAAMGSPGFIMINTDGSVGAPPSDIPGTDPTADRGDSSGIYMMYYDPTDSVQAPDSQVGHMKNDPDAEAADDKFLVGGNAEIATAAVFANFLSAAGKMNLWTAIPETNRTFDSMQLAKILKFHGKAG